MNIRDLLGSLRIRAKKVYQILLPESAATQLLFIVGCQRSGTTMLSQIFERDWHAKSFGEISELSCDDKEHGIRLNSLPRVEAQIQSVRAPLVVLKPIVESHRTLELLAHFPGSKAIWIYRDFRDVALSNVNRFGAGNPLRDLLPIVNDASGNWRSEFVPADVREIVLAHFAKDLSPCDAATLFWYVRNRIFFDLSLDANPDTVICRYESLVSDPVRELSRIYQFVQQPFPGQFLAAQVHARSVGKGKTLPIGDGIGCLARSLQDRLDSVWERATCRD